MKNFREKLHKLLAETLVAQRAHTKKYGECYSSCVDMQRLYEREATIKEIIVLAGGRVKA